MKYRFVITGSDNLQQWWLVELLLLSAKKVGQPQPFTIIWATANGRYPKYVPTSGELYITQLYENLPSGFYQPMNRISGVKNWVRNTPINEEYIVILDPDMVFLQQFHLEHWKPEPCKMVTGRYWWHDLKNFPDLINVYKKFGKSIVDETNIKPSIVPLCIHLDDLHCMASEWDQYTLMYRQWLIKNKYHWVSEMLAWDILAVLKNIDVDATYDLYVTPEDNGSIRTPFLHYYCDFKNHRGSWKLNKHDWRHKIPEGLKIPSDVNDVTKYWGELLFERFGGNFI